MTSFFSRHSTVFVLFLMAFMLSGWSVLLSRQQTAHMHEQTNEPDAFMENVVALVMNRQGSPSLKIEAPKMIHYATADATHIYAPRVTVYRESPAPWTINSDQADASNGMEKILFSDNVVIHHPADIANPDTTMQTASLTVFPDKKEASTADAVLITQPDTVVHAIGMLADLNDGTVKLLSDARGDYVPTS